jgi:hypothetical protein
MALLVPLPLRNTLKYNKFDTFLDRTIHRRAVRAAMNAKVARATTSSGGCGRTEAQFSRGTNE